ncbi:MULTISPECIES: GNAT family N-acetyltransferase [Pacificimonas]|uniref:GNAT family N-acetyltransferase n=1 Tax=Pacificimonas aurantium TaxID=1250540 RepID=A0ABS7WL65_9SPHN|nr:MULTISPECIES: GNAT family protein [Pacificimonas]MBZ6378292.1 GNAT family N-acetyltransferase [Pacificimonas aurantium]
MFITTKRLFLRPLWPEDAPLLARRMGEPEVLRNLGTPPSPFTLDAAKQKIAADAACWPSTVQLGAFLRTEDGPELAGGVGFGARADRGGETALSYWIAKEWQGRGISVEAGSALLEHAFLAHRLPTLTARHYADNPASGRVLEKLGFTALPGTQKVFCRPRGEDVDSICFSLTRADWERHSGLLAEPLRRAA